MEHLHNAGDQENTPSRTDGQTFIKNGLPSEAKKETGRQTKTLRTAARDRQISVSESDTPTTSNDQSDETAYVLPIKIMTTFVVPDFATNRGSG